MSTNCYIVLKVGVTMALYSYGEKLCHFILKSLSSWEYLYNLEGSTKPSVYYVCHIFTVSVLLSSVPDNAKCRNVQMKQIKQLP